MIGNPGRVSNTESSYYKAVVMYILVLVYFEIQIPLDKHGVSGTVKKPRLHNPMLKPKIVQIPTLDIFNWMIEKQTQHSIEIVIG